MEERIKQEVDAWADDFEKRHWGHDLSKTMPKAVREMAHLVVGIAVREAMAALVDNGSLPAECKERPRRPDVEQLY